MAIVWWEIETAAPEDFRAFHAAMWGWSFRPAFAGTELGADYWIVSDGDAGIGGLQRADGDAAPRAGVRLYLAVDDLEATLARAEFLGAVVERGRTALGGEDRWFATFVDPCGISFGVWTAEEAPRTPPAG